MNEIIITKEYLQTHPNEIFVFGDNTGKKGHGGAAALRDEPNTYGFITKLFADNHIASFFTYENYAVVYKMELAALISRVKNNPDKTYLISKLGAGLANRNKIFETVIEPNIKNDLKEFDNVKFLW